MVSPRFGNVFGPPGALLPSAIGWFYFDSLDDDIETACANFAKFKQERVPDCSEERVARSSSELRGWADAIVEDWDNLNSHCLDCGKEHSLCEVEGEVSIPESSILDECVYVATRS